MHWKDNVWKLGWKKRKAILFDEYQDWGGEIPEEKVYKKKKIRQTRIDDFIYWR